MTVRYTRQASSDLDEARAFVAIERPMAAVAMAERIRLAIDGLRLFPERGRAGRTPMTRELVVPGTPFLVAYCVSGAYRVSGRQIDVLAVTHGARRWHPDAGD